MFAGAGLFSSTGECASGCANSSWLIHRSVYAKADRVSWPPAKIFGDEITILGSFSETYMFSTYMPATSSVIHLLTASRPKLPQSTIWTLGKSRPRES